MRWSLGLRTFTALAGLPFLLVMAASLHMAATGRRAFNEMTTTLGTLSEIAVLEQKIRKGITRQLLAATSYLERGDWDAWSEFTRLAWSVYEDEARYLSLPLTTEERLAVERVRTQHRLFEGMAQAAMARRIEAPWEEDLRRIPRIVDELPPGFVMVAPREEDLRRIQEAFDQFEDAIEDVSRMIEGRLANAAATASEASARIGFAAMALALLFALATVVSSTLAFRGVLAPLESLQAATTRLEQGELSARASVRGIPAVAALARRFNSMAEELETLLHRLEERVEARTAQLAALESLSREGLVHLDRDTLLRTVVERMASAAAADAASLRVIEDGMLVSLAHQGLAEDAVRTRVPPAGWSRQVMETQRAHWIEELEGEERALPLCQGFRSMVVLPLSVEDRALGVIWLLYREGRGRDVDLIRVLEAMAARAALALERAEMVQQILQTAEDLRTANQRLLETQQRLVEAERLAAVGQVHIALRHEINNPLSVLTGGAEILETQANDPEVVRRWAAHIAEAALRITEVLRRLEELRRVETTSYGAGVPMVDLESKTEKR